MLPTVCGEFRVVEDPDLRFTPSGAAVSNLRLVASSRKKDEATNEWKDDKTCWINGTCWRDLAENVAESLRKGDLVEVRGRLETRNYEDRDGNKRSSMDLTIDSIGPSLRFRAVPHSDGAGSKVTRSSEPDTTDPFATPAAGQTEEPPF